ncbi:MAG TPA: DUF5668 domain-containing protein [Vicinamibacterales bacterium]|nr:DUF5668 domain-containing protein [Vicinamibacterales bacterium]
MMLPLPEERRPQQPSRLSPQLVFGTLVIAVGVLFLLDELGVVHAGDYVRYWPAGLIVVGLLKLWQSRDGFGGALAGLIFTTAGIWLLLEQLAVIRISFFDLWPLLLVFFGAYLVWQGVTPRTNADPLPRTNTDLLPRTNTDLSPRTNTDEHGSGAARDSATFTSVAILGGVARGNNSQAFRKANLVAVMGGCEVDLRQAAIHGEAAIDLFTMWGGIEIRVPDEWSVDCQVMPLMGGVDDKTRPPKTATAHRLVLRGVALMGGVEIKN